MAENIPTPARFAKSSKTPKAACDRQATAKLTINADLLGEGEAVRANRRITPIPRNIAALRRLTTPTGEEYGTF